MAIVQRNFLDKYIRYAKKYFMITIKGYSINAIKGRFYGPKVLIVSIPKSGTHMLEGILEMMPLLRNAGWTTINNSVDYNTKVQRLRNGMFANSHLYHTNELSALIKRNKIKTIFMIRDPRDIVISRYRYVTEIDYLHPAHEYLTNLDNLEDRITASILGVEDIMPSIQSALENFKGWLYENDVLKIRFEDLVGSAGEGSDKLRRETIQRIASFLSLEINDNEISHIDTSLRSKNTSTRRRGVIGGWKEEFKEQHKYMFRNTLNNLIHEYGYEYLDSK